MKKTLTKVMLIMLVIMSVFTSCNNSNDEYAPPTGYVLASDSALDYCLYVPDEWEVDTTTAATGAYFSKSDPSSVSLMTWELEYTDSTLEDWWAINQAEAEMVFTDFNLVSSENTTMDGLYAKRYIYTGKIGENSYKFLQQACIKNGSIYLFTYTSVEDKFDSHLSEVEDIIGFFIVK